MPYNSDSQNSGYSAARDARRSAAPEAKAIRYMVEVHRQQPGGDYETFREGDVAGYFFWSFDPEIGDFVTLPTSPPPEPSTTEKTREVIASDYMRSGPPTKQQDISFRRLHGSWNRATPCVIDENGKVRPIHSKDGGFDQSFLGKEQKLSGFFSRESDEDIDEGVDEVKPALGYNIPKGFPLLTAQCLNNKDYELLAFPAGNGLTVDHKSTLGEFSARVFDIKEDGFIDVDGSEAASIASAWIVEKNEEGKKVVAILGTEAGKDNTGHGAIMLPSADLEGAFNIFSYLSAAKGGPLVGGAVNDKHAIQIGGEISYNPAHISSDALFFRDNERDGPLRFTDLDFPETEDGDAIEVDLVYDGASDQWRWVFTPEEEEKVTARVRFNFQKSESGSVFDLSEAVISGSNEIVWIDYSSSDGVFYNTFGDSVEFVLEKIQDDFQRNGEIRKLFRIVSVRKDQGVPARFVEMVDLEARLARVLSGDDPFTSPGSNLATTDIDGTPQENVIRVKIPSQWTIGEDNPSQYQFMEVVDVSRGNNFTVAPISPTPKDATYIENGIMVSTLEVGGEPISEYIVADPKADSGNSLVNGLTVHRSTDPEKSHDLRQKNGTQSLVGEVISYNENSQMAQVKNVFDLSNPAFVHNVWIRPSGKKGSVPASEIEVGEPIEYLRVGVGNGAGSGSEGPAGFELYEENPTKVSYVHFFFEQQRIDVGIPIIATGELATLLVTETGTVVSAREKPPQVRFADTNLRQVIAAETIDRSGNPYKIGSTNAKRILALETDQIPPNRAIAPDCESELTPNRVFTFSVLPGIIKETGEEIFVFKEPATLGFSPLCCPDGEDPPTDPPTDPPDDPPTDPPPDPDPEPTPEPVVCPPSTTMHLTRSDGGTQQHTMELISGPPCLYSSQEGQFGFNLAYNGVDKWIFTINGGFGPLLRAEKTGDTVGDNPFGSYPDISGPSSPNFFSAVCFP